ncbi:cyclic nucleotide-binding domain-containing protein [Aquimarina sp. 2201CG14-23]|uniref:cyclic nucleotide-binding domain-containing protein n=1 Tax=Aquimarina mycalae TaxID=3040073 RepID=UPI002477D935|nr:cyclic nucleotide-binding domain-containing protein [Aquimarina sp. 2201CG14-23]MDH7448376.1 cyclic nucleotide-binding domain-containing protein [Aquimarina sp. 2201CG14-23]
MKNTIAERIQDFLKEFPPFNILEKEELLEISGQVKVLYLEKDNYVFQQNEECHEEFYIVREGAIGLYRITEKDEDLIDISDVGDLFGLRVMIIKKNYRMSAKADEESIVYAIPSSVFKPFIDTNKEVNNFLLETFATHARGYYTETEKGKKIDNTIAIEAAADLSSLRTISYRKKPLICTPNDIVKDIAVLMNIHKENAIVVVDSDKYPLGIITDTDLRAKVVTGLFSAESLATDIMTSPVRHILKKQQLQKRR